MVSLLLQLFHFLLKMLFLVLLRRLNQQGARLGPLGRCRCGDKMSAGAEFARMVKDHCGGAYSAGEEPQERVQGSQGCDGSVLLDDTSDFTGEKSAKPNSNSLRGFDVIDKIKSEVEKLCPGIVSCADIIAVAARDSVVLLGGPSWTVQLGRRDSTTASLSAANSDIPSPLLDLSDLITSFTNKGFTAKEMVALAGGHTIGKAQCTTFRERV